jgi:hypothetical protein
MTIGVGFVVGSLTVLACDHVAPSFHKARDLRRGIQDVSSLRYTVAHENAHLRLESQGPNFMTVGLYTAVIAVFMRHVKTVLTALLEERDPEQRRILHEVLRDLLEPFRRGKRR